MRVSIAFLALLAFCCGATAQDAEDKVSETWKFLAKKYDMDGNGEISKSEYTRGEDKFAGYDRNGDGKLTSADFPAERRRRGARGGRGGRGDRGGRGMGGGRMNEMMTKRFFTRMVAGGKKKAITPDDWKLFVAKVDCDDDGVVDDAAFEGDNARMMRFVLRALDADRNESLEVEELNKAFAGLDKNQDKTLQEDEFFMERGRRGGRGGRGDRGGRRGGRRDQEGLPKAGDKAPDFNLPKVGKQKEEIRLSSFAGKKPVALIFGSYT